MRDLGPEELLFTDRTGVRADLQDVIYDGLDVDYRDRYPALLHLLNGGAPAHRLYACAMLASWGVPDALRTIAQWASDPAVTPWADAPVTFERFGGADAAFELLTDAVGTAAEALGRDATVDALRAEAIRAILGAYDRVFVGRAVATVLDLDPALAARVRDQVGPAVERALEALRGAPAFDLRTQTASLIGALAAIDDDHAASAAEALLVQVGRWTPAVNEVASALGHGTGPATFGVLERLAEHGAPSVQALARESLGRRRAAVVANLAEGMCAARTTSEADLLDALGVTLDAPPLGGTAARVRGGDIPTFEVDVPDGTLTRADLDARLGEPRRLPQTGAHASILLWYGVAVPDAAHACSVFARFEKEPRPVSPVASVLLRLDPARPVRT